MSERTRTRPVPQASKSPRLLLVVMCVGYFLVLLDVTIVNVALPRIGAGLGTSVSGLQWVVYGYAIALASLMLGAGTIGDLRGHKRVVLSGLALFGLASLGCGLAPGTAVLVGFRLLRGVGAALLLPGTLAVVTNAFPESGERARAIGLWAGIGSVALAAGPLLGGVLVQGIGWQAGGAIGIAAFGALAGQPTGRHFITGFHAAALIAAALFLAAAVATVVVLPAGTER